MLFRSILFCTTAQADLFFYATNFVAVFLVNLTVYRQKNENNFQISKIILIVCLDTFFKNDKINMLNYGYQ